MANILQYPAYRISGVQHNLYIISPQLPLDGHDNFPKPQPHETNLVCQPLFVGNIAWIYCPRRKVMEGLQYKKLPNLVVMVSYVDGRHTGYRRFVLAV